MMSTRYYLADGVIPGPSDTPVKQATDEFRADAHYALSKRQTVRRKRKEVYSFEMPEVLDLFAPKSKKARTADALSSPKSA